ncbi:MAG: M10 family metallopeptidase [Devosia sp.]|uniref:M10 family metallopeptidase n=1 Tax=Devosia sp. 66-22 TaxID=1895753 RepID=UPI000926E0C6|nr:M10 family metallopeptidase [Devosia sp. 66-22]MBN9348699.1 M10 family metallopeptidase [Devosia sp.]OJX52383.1 MAG: hypothetical protein BGO81_09310 [Devosia sp. 66-22]
MATPTTNSVSTSRYDTSVFDSSLDTMLYGVKWGGSLGKGVTLTYSFPQDPSYWAWGYSEPDSYYSFDAAQMAAARSALASWAAVANVKFREVVDTSETVGEIRFAFTNNIDPDAAAHAYLPSNQPQSGDVWVSPDYLYDNPAPGSFFHNTLIHEIGHSLGLRHSFDVEPQYDNYFYSVMSYTASPWSADGDGYASFNPTTPMYLDILAMQALYGAKDLKSNHGNTTYAFYDDYYFQTIFDTGGKDTIVYAGSDTCSISLTKGSFSVLSMAIDFSTVTSRSTVAIGPGTVIENARGGNQNDTISGNSSKNKLEGWGGDDSIWGGGGKDVLVGGFGADQLSGGSGNDRFDFNSVAEIGIWNTDIILDFSRKKDDIDLSTIDANVYRGGNNKFSFVKKADMTLNGKAGELCWYKSGGNTYVMGDVDGDANADFVLALLGSKTLSAGDFIL